MRPILVGSRGVYTGPFRVQGLHFNEPVVVEQFSHEDEILEVRSLNRRTVIEWIPREQLLLSEVKLPPEEARLRNEFAKAALPVILDNALAHNPESFDEVAKLSYQMADAMLKAEYE